MKSGLSSAISRNLSLPLILRKVAEIFELVREKVVDKIDRAEWMSPRIKDLSKEKIKRIRGDFVGSDIYFDRELLRERYRGVRISLVSQIFSELHFSSFQISMSSDYFSNVIAMFRHFRTNIYHFVNVPVDRETYTWNLISFPFTVNAFHLQQLNSIGCTKLTNF